MVVAAVCALMSATSLANLVHARAEVTAGDCTWVAKADPDRLNVAYPDQGAGYWLAGFALRLTGTETFVP